MPPVDRANAVRTVSGNPPLLITYPEGASQVFKAGELVMLSGGYVVVWNGSGLILGMAADNAGNTTAGARNIGVYIAHPDTIFEFSKTDASGVAAATAVTDVGSGFAIYQDSTNRRVTAYTGSGTYRLLCVDLSYKDKVGDSGGRILCTVLGKYCQLYCTS